MDRPKNQFCDGFGVVAGNSCCSGEYPLRKDKGLFHEKWMCCMNVELRGDRVAKDDSIVARSDGSFYDFNGAVNYASIEALLEQRPELADDGDYTAPEEREVSQKEKVEMFSLLVDRMRSLPIASEETLIDYVPYFSSTKQTVRNALIGEHDGNIAVRFRDANKKDPLAIHVRTANGWRMITGSDAFAFEALPASDGYVYAVFGSGDYLAVRLLGLRYLAFGSDIAVKSSRAKFDEVKSIINAGQKKPAKIRLIHDNDKSGRETIGALRDAGFEIEVFRWDLVPFAKPKWDLRDLCQYLESRKYPKDDAYDFITNGGLYGF